MGITARKLGKVEEAIAHFEAVLDVAPDHPEREAMKTIIDQLRARRRGAPPDPGRELRP